MSDSETYDYKLKRAFPNDRLNKFSYRNKLENECTVKTGVYYLHAYHVTITQTHVYTLDVVLTRLIFV